MKAGFWVFGLVAAIATLTSAGPGVGARSATGGLVPPPRAAVGRLESQLAQVARAERSGGAAAAATQARAEGLSVAAGRVRVIVAARAGDVAGAESAVASAGGSVEAEADGLVQALVAPGSLVQVAASGAVAAVRPPATPFPMTISDEGVTATNANVWQSSGCGGGGCSGSGVKIAIIDIGFYGYASLLGTALP